MDVYRLFYLPNGVLASTVGNHVGGGRDTSYRAHGDDVATVLEHVGQELEDGPKLRADPRFTPCALEMTSDDALTCEYVLTSKIFRIVSPSENSRKGRAGRIPALLMSIVTRPHCALVISAAFFTPSRSETSH